LGDGKTDTVAAPAAKDRPHRPACRRKGPYRKALRPAHALRL